MTIPAVASWLQWPSQPYRYAAAAAAVGALTLVLVPARQALGLLNVGLCFLLLVVLIAARWNWGPGIFASVTANLTFNFFFVPPLHTFTVQQPRNVLALTVFLVVASVTSALLSRARQGEAAERRRAAETLILYDLSRLIITAPSTAVALTSLCGRVREAFSAEVCAVILSGEDGPRVLAWSGALDQLPSTSYERRAVQEALATRQPVYLGGPRGQRRPRIVGLRDRAAPSAFVPLQVGDALLGVLQVAGPAPSADFAESDRRLMNAFADVAALAVERDRMLHEAARVAALQETGRLKSVLLSAVSHDLRTPLTTILTAASSLLQEDVHWDEATRQEFLTSIEGQALRLSRLVSNLLDLSRIEGGALQAEADWYDVRELLESAIDAVGPALGRHTVTLDAPPDVGMARFDHVQLGQVLVNLLENAAKFAPPETKITVSACRHHDRVEISVADRGPGIPAAERARVFEKFYRRAATRTTPGTGLGLAICKGLVEANGGTISVTEHPGGGARFIITLPASALAITHPSGGAGQ